MKLIIALFLCIIACIHSVISSKQTELTDDKLLEKAHMEAASFAANPARGEERLSAMFDEMTSPAILEKLSTPGHISKAQRKKKSLQGTRLIRRIIKRARMKATSLQGKKARHISSAFQNKFESAATKVQILFKLTIYRYSKLRF
jgi:hypothetical protein